MYFAFFAVKNWKAAKGAKSAKGMVKEVGIGKVSPERSGCPSRGGNGEEREGACSTLEHVGNDGKSTNNLGKEF